MLSKLQRAHESICREFHPTISKEKWETKQQKKAWKIISNFNEGLKKHRVLTKIDKILLNSLVKRHHIERIAVGRPWPLPLHLAPVLSSPVGMVNIHQGWTINTNTHTHIYVYITRIKWRGGICIYVYKYIWEDLALIYILMLGEPWTLPLVKGFLSFASVIHLLPMLKGLHRAKFAKGLSKDQRTSLFGHWGSMARDEPVTLTTTEKSWRSFGVQMCTAYFSRAKAITINERCFRQLPSTPLMPHSWHHPCCHLDVDVAWSAGLTARHPPLHRHPPPHSMKPFWNTTTVQETSLDYGAKFKLRVPKGPQI